MIPCGNPHPHPEHTYTRWVVRLEGDSKASQAFCDGGRAEQQERLMDDWRDSLADIGLYE